jgi:hypothetical protein
MRLAGENQMRLVGFLCTFLASNFNPIDPYTSHVIFVNFVMTFLGDFMYLEEQGVA